MNRIRKLIIEVQETKNDTGHLIYGEENDELSGASGLKDEVMHRFANHEFEYDAKWTCLQNSLIGEWDLVFDKKKKNKVIN